MAPVAVFSMVSVTASSLITAYFAIFAADNALLSVFRRIFGDFYAWITRQDKVLEPHCVPLYFFAFLAAFEDISPLFIGISHTIGDFKPNLAVYSAAGTAARAMARSLVERQNSENFYFAYFRLF